MSFEKIRENKKESVDFIIDHIGKVIKTFGKRSSGSEGEKKAAEYMGELLKPYADEVRLEPFPVHPSAFYGWIYLSVTLYLIGLVAYFFQPVASLVLFVVATFIMAGEFVMYKKLVDNLFVKKTSYNLYAVKHPSGEIKRRILFNGHMDAAFEWTFNYHLGGKGYIAHVVTSMVGVLYFFVVIILGIANKYAASPFLHGNVANILGYVCLVFVPLWIGMYFMWNEKIVSDGANDDLTGCFMSIALMKALKDNGVTLENTEIGVVLTGSEEAGLRGSKAFCEAHKNDFKDVETLVFSIDTIHNADCLGVNVADLNNTVPSDPHAIDLFYNAALDVGVPIIKTSVPFGATDSAGFNQGGLKAVGITAMSHELEDYYHTRRDTADNLDRTGLENCFEAAVRTIERFDEGL